MKNLKRNFTIGISAVIIGIGTFFPAYSQQTQQQTIIEESVREKMMTVSGKVYMFEGETVNDTENEKSAVLTNVDIMLQNGAIVRGYSPKDYTERGSFYRFYKAANKHARVTGLEAAEVKITGYKLTEQNFKESKCEKYDKDKKGLIMKILEVGDEKFKFD